MAGAVVHLGDAVGALIAGGRAAVASVDQHLAHRVVYLIGRHARLDRLERHVQRLQRRRVHPAHLFRNLTNDHCPGQVSVVVAAAARWKDVDDHRRAGADLALAAVVRHGVVRRPGDDHVGARKSELRQEKRRARVEPLGRHRLAVGPQQSLANLASGKKPHDLGHRLLSGLLRMADLVRLVASLVPPLGLEQRLVDLDVEARVAQRFQIASLQSRRNPRFGLALLAQQLGREHRIRAIRTQLRVARVTKRQDACGP